MSGNLQMEFHLKSAAQSAAQIAAQTAEVPQLRTMSPEAQVWSARVGKQFLVRGDNGADLAAVRLEAVEPSRLQPLRSFALLFLSVEGPAFCQGLYALRQTTGEDSSPDEHLLFLVPLGPANDAMQYEAVFNL